MAKALGFAEVGAHVFNELLASHLHAGIKPAEATFFLCLWLVIGMCRLL